MHYGIMSNIDEKHAQTVSISCKQGTTITMYTALTGVQTHNICTVSVITHCFKSVLRTFTDQVKGHEQ